MKMILQGLEVVLLFIFLTTNTWPHAKAEETIKYTKHKDSDAFSLSSESVHEALTTILEDYDHRVLPSEHGERINVDLDIFFLDMEITETKSTVIANFLIFTYLTYMIDLQDVHKFRRVFSSD